MKESTRKALELFVERADHLMSRRFTQSVIQAGGTTLTIRFHQKDEEDDDGWLNVNRTGPDEEAVEAFVLTYRQFFQHNDRFSFPSLAKPAIQDDPGLSAEWKQKFRESWAELQEFLDAPAPFILSGEAPTYRHLLDVFVYGGLAHTTPDKRVVFESWQGDPMLYALLEHAFVGSLASVLKGIWYFRQFTAKVLGLPQASPPFRPSPHDPPSENRDA